MSLFERLRGGLKGVQAALLAPAADPRQEFASVYERQLVLLQQVREALEALRAYKARLVQSIFGVSLKLPQLGQQARESLSSGSEEAARVALQRQAMADAEVKALSEQLQVMEVEEQRLSTVEQRVAIQIEAFATQQTLLAARSSAAHTQLQLREQLLGVSDELAALSASLEDTEKQARKMQARAIAIDDLIESGLSSGGSASSRNRAGGKIDKQVEAALAALKTELRR